MKFIILLLFLCIHLFSKELPVFFVGTFNEKDSMLSNHLLKELNAEDNGWALTKYTEHLLKNDLKNISTNDKVNILTSKDFNNYIETKLTKDTKNISTKARKIGFFNLESDHREFSSEGLHLVELTMNLTFIQIGEEKNRNTEDNSFEVRYSAGVSYISRVNYKEKSKKYDSFYNLYKESYKEALKKLLLHMNEDDNKKNTELGMSKNDLFFIVKSFKIGKKSKDLVAHVFKDNIIAKNVLMTMYQKHLIKKIRKDKELDNIVLFYPPDLNKKIYKNWKIYLSELKKKISSYKGRDARIVIRDIKPTCEDKQNKNRQKYFDGYYIKALLGNLEEKVIEKESTAQIKTITARSLAQVIVPLTENQKLDGLSSNDNKIKKLNLYLGQHSEGVLVANSLDGKRNSIIIKAIEESINKLSEETVNAIIKINKMRKDNRRFKLKYLCEE